jgi:hypothetical protein
VVGAKIFNDSAIQVQEGEKERIQWYSFINPNWQHLHNLITF